MRPQLTPTRPTSDPGVSQPGWKLISFIRRRADLSAAEFMAAWRDLHVAPIADRRGFWRHVRRYVQNRALTGGRAPLGLPAEYDGVAELWFDGVDDLRATVVDPSFGAAEAKALELIDTRTSVSWVAEVTPVKGIGQTNIKLFAAGHARAGLTRSQAQAYWRDKHPGVLAQEAPACWRMIERYDQAHTRSVGGLHMQTLTDRYDFCAEVGMDSVEAMQELFTRPDYLSIVRADELRFASVEDSLACATHAPVVHEL